jgi:hypothetical protein
MRIIIGKCLSGNTETIDCRPNAVNAGGEGYPCEGADRLTRSTIVGSKILVRCSEFSGGSCNIRREAFNGAMAARTLRGGLLLVVLYDIFVFVLVQFVLQFILVVLLVVLVFVFVLIFLVRVFILGLIFVV